MKPLKAIFDSARTAYSYLFVAPPSVKIDLPNPIESFSFIDGGFLDFEAEGRTFSPLHKTEAELLKLYDQKHAGAATNEFRTAIALHQMGFNARKEGTSALSYRFKGHGRKPDTFTLACAERRLDEHGHWSEPKELELLKSGKEPVLFSREEAKQITNAYDRAAKEAGLARFDSLHLVATSKEENPEFEPPPEPSAPLMAA